MNEEKIKDRIAAGESFESILLDDLVMEEFPNAKIVDDCLVLDSDVIYADDGNCEVAYPASTHKESAKSYVDDGDWGNSDSTFWVRVSTYRNGIDTDGDDVRCDLRSHTITVDPQEPDCVNGEEHDWKSPYAVLGGLKENPGVHGHGGGCISTQVCAHCGKYMTSDSWAQNPETGEQGLNSVSYKDADDDSREWVEKRLLEKVVEPALDECDAVIEYKNNDTEIIATLREDMDFDEALKTVIETINNERIDWLTYDEDARTMTIRVVSW